MRKTSPGHKVKGLKRGTGPSRNLALAYCDREGNVYEWEGKEPAFREGRRCVRVRREELIPLPFGTLLFSLPGRRPVAYDRGKKEFIPLPSGPGGDEILAASAFLSSGYLRTYLPAFGREEGAPPLPLWAYAGLVFLDGEFHAPAVRIDRDPRSDPEIHQNDPELARAIRRVKKAYAANRLVGQLARCAIEYRCLCARNFFLGRHEVPVPTTPACNARCAGCLSHQEDSGFRGSQDRLDFKPTRAEIAEVILHHFAAVPSAVASFGQGCEGEPLLRADDLAGVLRKVRRETGRGTINLNTNGSLPEKVKLLIDAGLDSIRISLNSPTEEYYTRYHRPVNYLFSDVLKSIEAALEKGIFVSINLFFLPGFTDMESEAGELLRFLRRFPVSMIQTRNLNVDPDYYLDRIGFRETAPLGIKNLLETVRREFPAVRLGYYNPPKESF